MARRHFLAVALAFVIGGVAAITAYAAVIDANGVIHGCYSNSPFQQQHILTLTDAACPAGWTAISWNQQGPQGPQGAVGPQGPAGPRGPAGGTTQDCTARYSGANLAGCYLTSANLSSANLNGDNLVLAYLVGANLSQADLFGANLTGAYLDGANLSDADLAGATMSLAHVPGVIWSYTVCPDGTNSHFNNTSPESCVGHGA
jgi:Pentapeptide repeats (8 copies)